MKKSIASLHWKKHLPVIKMYLEDEKRTIVPALVKKFGEKNFKLKGDSVFLFGKEIVVDDKKINKIISDEEENYGGQTKAFDRIQRKYIGISRRDVAKVFRGSERRQLKARYQPAKNNGNFVYAGQPGHVEIDLTFYKNQKYPIFGAIDVYSRYCFYKRVKDKKAASLLVVLKEFLKKFSEVSNFKVKRISTDSGPEFGGPFTEFLAQEPEPHIYYDRKVKSRKLIENLNNSLRQYVERIGWDTVSDLDELVRKFTESYNNSKHSTTKQVPNILVAIDKESVKSGRRTIPKKGSAGYNKAILKPGDRVRLYDPRHTDLKKEQKARLKGRIKLSKDDYVKQYTSFHRGQAAHWTTKIFTIKKVIEGKKRATRYLLNEKKGSFFRHEVQKVTAITKPDPRKAILEARKAKAEANKKALPAPVRPAKYVRKEYILQYEEDKSPRKDDPATILDVYKNFFIVFHESLLFTFAHPKELSKATGKSYPKADVMRWLKENPDDVVRVKKEIDDTIQELLI